MEISERAIPEAAFTKRLLREINRALERGGVERAVRVVLRDRRGEAVDASEAFRHCCAIAAASPRGSEQQQTAMTVAKLLWSGKTAQLSTVAVANVVEAGFLSFAERLVRESGEDCADPGALAVLASIRRRFKPPEGVGAASTVLLWVLKSFGEGTEVRSSAPESVPAAVVADWVVNGLELDVVEKALDRDDVVEAVNAGGVLNRIQPRVLLNVRGLTPIGSKLLERCDRDSVLLAIGRAVSDVPIPAAVVCRSEDLVTGVRCAGVLLELVMRAIGEEDWRVLYDGGIKLEEEEEVRHEVARGAPISKLVEGGNFTSLGRVLVANGDRDLVLSRAQEESDLADEDGNLTDVGGGIRWTSRSIAVTSASKLVRNGELTEAGKRAVEHKCARALQHKLSPEHFVHDGHHISPAARVLMAEGLSVEIGQRLPSAALVEPGSGHVSEAGRLVLETCGGWGVAFDRFPLDGLLRNGSLTAAGREAFEVVGPDKFQASGDHFVRDGRLTDFGDGAKGSAAFIRSFPISELHDARGDVTSAGAALFETLADASPAIIADFATRVASSHIPTQSQLLSRTSGGDGTPEKPTPLLVELAAHEIVSPAFVRRIDDAVLAVSDPASVHNAATLTPVGRLLLGDSVIATKFAQQYLVPSLCSDGGALTLLGRALLEDEGVAKEAVRAAGVRPTLLIHGLDAAKSELCVLLTRVLGNEPVAAVLAKHISNLPAATAARIPGIANHLRSRSDREDLLRRLMGDTTLERFMIDDAIANMVTDDSSLARIAVERRGLQAISALEHAGVTLHPAEFINRWGSWTFFAAVSMASVMSDIWLCISLFREGHEQDTDEAIRKPITNLAISSLVFLTLTFLVNVVITRWFINKVQDEMLDIGCPHFADATVWGETRLVSSVVIASCIATPEAGTLLYGSLTPPMAMAALKSWTWPAAILEDLTHFAIQFFAFVYDGSGGVSLYVSAATTFLQLAFRAARALAVSCVVQRHLGKRKDSSATSMFSAAFGGGALGAGSAHAPLSSSSSSGLEPLMSSAAMWGDEEDGKDDDVIDPWDLAEEGYLDRPSRRTLLWLIGSGLGSLLFVALPAFAVLGALGNLLMDTKDHECRVGLDSWLRYIVAAYVLGFISRMITVSAILRRSNHKPYIVDVLLQPELHGVTIMGSILGDTTMYSMLNSRSIYFNSTLRETREGINGKDHKGLSAVAHIGRVLSSVLNLIMLLLSYFAVSMDCVQSEDMYDAALFGAIVGFLAVAILFVLVLMEDFASLLKHLAVASKSDARCSGIACLMTFLFIMSWVVMYGAGIIMNSRVVCYTQIYENKQTTFPVQIAPEGATMTWPSVLDDPFLTDDWIAQNDDSTDLGRACPPSGCTGYLGTNTFPVPIFARWDHINCDNASVVSSVSIKQQMVTSCAEIFVGHNCTSTNSLNNTSIREVLCRLPAGSGFDSCKGIDLNSLHIAPLINGSKGIELPFESTLSMSIASVGFFLSSFPLFFYIFYVSGCCTSLDGRTGCCRSMYRGKLTGEYALIFTAAFGALCIFAAESAATKSIYAFAGLGGVLLSTFIITAAFFCTKNPGLPHGELSGVWYSLHNIFLFLLTVGAVVAAFLINIHIASTSVVVLIVLSSQALIVIIASLVNAFVPCCCPYTT